MLVRIRIMPQAYDLALVVEGPEVHFFVAEMAAGVQDIGFNDKFSCNLAAAVHHGNNPKFLNLEDLRIADQLKERQDAVLTFHELQPGHAGFLRGIVGPGFPVDVIRKMAENGRYIAFAEGFVNGLYGDEILAHDFSYLVKNGRIALFERYKVTRIITWKSIA